jgi:hypothetical protein
MEPLTVLCPLTGRLGSFVPGRDARPGAPRVLGVAATAAGRCDFCAGDVPTDPDPVVVRRGTTVWRSCPNRWPAVAGHGAGAWVVFADEHGPALSSPADTQHDDWVALLTAQQQLAMRRPAWSLVVVNVGASAGASQPHKHGQVLDLPSPPPVVVERTRTLASPPVAAQVLADPLRLADVGDLALVVPAVPYGPDDLRVVPTGDVGFDEVDPAGLATLVVRWLAELRRGRGPGTTPEVKLVVHDRVAGRGRAYVDLLATDRHGPVAGITPFVELAEPPALRADRLRSTPP